MYLVRSAVILALMASQAVAEEPAGARRPRTDDELKFWLENMLVWHRFETQEVTLATGLTTEEIDAAINRLGISRKRPPRDKDAPLVVLPYPGGRHPRIGFLDGAVNPQRETKVSIFAPWADGGYAVADVPEAIWHETSAGRKLLYLAHTHVPTIWDEQKSKLEPLEWTKVEAKGKIAWQVERTLPNKVVFGTSVAPHADHVEMHMWLTNGTPETLGGLVVQNCVMLKGLVGFDQQTNDNKLLQKPYVACHNSDKTRWIITAWEPCQRPWANAPCPCLHSDPKFPDCEPGKTVRIRGWLSFFEGKDIEAELKRIDGIGWRTN
jgi:hypothetical protein